jgi:carboxymethylenebutenolidase
MTTTTTTLSTAHGPMRTEVVRPSNGKGPWPAVYFCIDGVGLRPSLVQMAQRIADDAGAVVVVPDLFHRSGDVYDMVPPDAPKESSSLWKMLGNPESRAAWRARFFDVAVNVANVKADAEAVFAFLDGPSEVSADVVKGAVATTGYCMGGHISMKLAGLFPERVKVAASFHGGFLSSDAPDSPHTLAPKMKARVYVAAAPEDFTPESKARLIKSLDDAGVSFVFEDYASRHGWCVPDSPSFNAADADKAHRALVERVAGLRG